MGFDYVVFLVQVHNVKGDYHDLKNGTCVRYLFLCSSHKVHNYNHSSLRFNDEYSFYVLENGVLHRCLFWFSCHKMHNDNDRSDFAKQRVDQIRIRSSQKSRGRQIGQRADHIWAESRSDKPEGRSDRAEQIR